MIPVSCFLEVVLDNVQYSRDTKLSIVLVLLGVAVCTVTDVSVNTKGFIAAFVAVWSTSLQQYVSYLSLNLWSYISWQWENWATGHGLWPSGHVGLTRKERKM